jgi:hypothetical protein
MKIEHHWSFAFSDFSMVNDTVAQLVKTTNLSLIVHLFIYFLQRF